MINKPLFIHEKLVWLYMRFLILMAIILPNKVYLKWRYRKAMGKSLNIDKPVLFQEKLQWLKLNDHKPVYHQMADKQDAKQFIASKVGEEYIIPTIGLYNSVEEIDFSKLPDQFVLKGTFDSGSYYICKDKSQINLKEMKKRLTANWNINYYHFSKEWPYKGLKHRIIAEPLLTDNEYNYLRDFKFYTFNGEPKFFYITSDRESKDGVREDFFDLNGNLLEFNQCGYYNNPNTPALPKNLTKMIEMSRVLASNTYHLRVDFYEVNGKIYVGELTFFDGGGFAGFEPEKYDRILGDWIKLPI